MPPRIMRRGRTLVNGDAISSKFIQNQTLGTNTTSRATVRTTIFQLGITARLATMPSALTPNEIKGTPGFGLCRRIRTSRWFDTRVRRLVQDGARRAETARRATNGGAGAGIGTGARGITRGDGRTIVSQNLAAGTFLGRHRIFASLASKLRTRKTNAPNLCVFASQTFTTSIGCLTRDYNTLTRKGIIHGSWIGTDTLAFASKLRTRAADAINGCILARQAFGTSIRGIARNGDAGASKWVVGSAWIGTLRCRRWSRACRQGHARVCLFIQDETWWTKAFSHTFLGTSLWEWFCTSAWASRSTLLVVLGVRTSGSRRRGRRRGRRRPPPGRRIHWIEGWRIVVIVLGIGPIIATPSPMSVASKTALLGFINLLGAAQRQVKDC